MNRRRFFGLLAAAPVALKLASKAAPLVAEPVMQAYCLTQHGPVVMDGISIRYIQRYDSSQDRMISRVESRTGPGGRTDLLPRFAGMYPEFSCRVVG